MIHRICIVLSMIGIAALASCSSVGNRAPVVDRLPVKNPESTVSSDGYYSVKPGDTLFKIASNLGMDWRELARMNGLGDPNRLNVGQKLLVQNVQGVQPNASLPSSEGDSGVVVTPIPPVSISRPIDPVPATPVEPIKPPSIEAGPSVTNKTNVSGFVWPHSGEVIQHYKAGTNKGIDLSAKIGDPVVSSMAGKVVYAGNALRGYGNLVILKHSESLLTAYAHNRTLLVKEGETVKKGQKIAEAGQSDSDRPKVHFEVRKQGKPVDPMEYLPNR